MHLQVLSTITLQLLRLLVKILLRSNVSHRTLTELAKPAFSEITDLLLRWAVTGEPPRAVKKYWRHPSCCRLFKSGQT